MPSLEPASPHGPADQNYPPLRERRDQDLRRLRRYLDESALNEQERLPPERDLAELLGLSRARLRNALRKVADEGLIWRHVGKGTFFGPVPVPNLGEIQAAAFLPDLSNPQDIMEARLSLEPELARIAAIRATRQDFNEMDACLENLQVAPSGPAWDLWDLRLHRTIAKAAENRVMLGMFDLMHSRRNKEVWGNLRHIFHTPDRMREVHQEHVAFVEAIKGRNPDDSHNLMRNHLMSVRRIIFRER